jgi:hypothetical protein
LIEFIQPFVNRYGELNDFLANCTGVIIGGGLMFSFSRLNAMKVARANQGSFGRCGSAHRSSASSHSLNFQYHSAASKFDTVIRRLNLAKHESCRTIFRDRF